MRNYKKTKTRFTEKVRIDPVKKELLRKHKNTRTIAGFLDTIINQHFDTNSSSLVKIETTPL